MNRQYQVEAWAMPDPQCTDQRRRELLRPPEIVNASSPEEARTVYLANYPVPEAFLRDRHRVGPLVIVRVSYVRGGK